MQARPFMTETDLWHEWRRKQRRYESWQRRVYNNLSSRAGEWQRREIDELAKEFSRFARPTGMILEIGCGAARLAPHLSEVKFFGVDPLVQPIDIKVKFCQAVGEWLPFKGESFNHVIAFGVLDHVADLDAVLSEARRVLRPGGRFSAMCQVTPDTPGLTHAWRLARKAWVKLTRGDLSVIPRAGYFLLFRDDMFHMRRFGKAELLHLLGKHFGSVLAKERETTLYLQAEKQPASGVACGPDPSWGAREPAP